MSPGIKQSHQIATPYKEGLNIYWLPRTLPWIIHKLTAHVSTCKFPTADPRKPFLEITPTGSVLALSCSPSHLSHWPDLFQLSHITDSVLSSQPLQDTHEPDSVTMKNEAVHSSKMPENSSTTQHKNFKMSWTDQQTPGLLSLLKECKLMK